MAKSVGFLVPEFCASRDYSKKQPMRFLDDPRLPASIILLSEMRLTHRVFIEPVVGVRRNAHDTVRVGSTNKKSITSEAHDACLDVFWPFEKVSRPP